MYLASSLGPVIVGAMCDGLNYRPTFAVMAVVAIALIPLTRYMLAPLSARAADYS